MSRLTGWWHEARAAPWAAALGIVYVVSTFDRPVGLRLVISGVRLEIGFVMLWIVVGLHLLTVATRRDRHVPDVLYAALPWLIVMIVSGAQYLPAYRVLPYALRSWTLAAAAILAAAHYRTQADALWLRRAVYAAIWIQVVAALIQANGGIGRPMGTFFVATAMCALLAVSLALPLGDVFQGRVVLPLTSATAIIATTALSSSRLALAAVAVGTLVSVVARLAPPAWRATAAVVAGAAAATAFVAVLTLAVANYSGPAPDRDGSTRYSLDSVAAHLVDLRLPMYRLGLAIWRDRPLWGVGGPSRHGLVAETYTADLSEYGGNVAAYPREARARNHLRHLHQQFLQMAVWYGAAGLLAWLGLLGYIGMRLAARLAARANLHAATMGLAVLSTFLVLGILDVPTVYIATECGLLLGASLGLSYSTQPAGRSSPSR